MYIYKVKLTYRDHLAERLGEDEVAKWETIEKVVIHDIDPGCEEAFSLACRMAIEYSFGKEAKWEDWCWAVENITFIADAPISTEETRKEATNEEKV